MYIDLCLPDLYLAPVGMGGVVIGVILFEDL